MKKSSVKRAITWSIRDHQYHTHFPSESVIPPGPITYTQSPSGTSSTVSPHTKYLRNYLPGESTTLATRSSPLPFLKAIIVAHEWLITLPPTAFGPVATAYRKNSTWGKRLYAYTENCRLWLNHSRNIISSHLLTHLAPGSDWTWLVCCKLFSSGTKSSMSYSLTTKTHMLNSSRCQSDQNVLFGNHEPDASLVQWWSNFPSICCLSASSPRPTNSTR